eukprot:TRINITY_DN1187_c0_g1_i2.p1 TRINITY_DN1187_c0_g1~~TRINITY_DN1187_c0_g1_i2.p1  ORF type:complete len:423 (+),score=128.89 TRINITY_DN1187_c0_g1_i2:68-1270(+)
MPPFRVGPASEVSTRHPTRVKHPEFGSLCLIPSASGFRAVDDECPHKRARLSDGDIEDIRGDTHVRCPKHRRKFNGGLYFSGKTGRAWCPDSMDCRKFDPSWAVRTYETLVDEHGVLWIGNAAGSARQPVKQDDSADWTEWQLTHVREAGENSFVYRLECGRSADSDADEYSWHVALKVPGASVDREYTPLSTRAAWRRGSVDILIKLYRDGQLTSRLFDAKPGDRWLLTAPRTTLDTPVLQHPGTRVRRSRHRRLCLALFAGGTGIAPMWQLLQGALQEGGAFGDRMHVRVSLLSSHSTPKATLLAQDLAELARISGGKLVLSFTVTSPQRQADWQGSVGRVDAAMAERVCAAATGGALAADDALRCIVSGPQGFNDHCRLVLCGGLRIPADDVVVLDA